MSWQAGIITALLAVAVLVEFACCVGILVMPTTLQRLHYVGPATTIGPACIAAAVAISRGPSTASGLTAILIAFILIVGSPLVTHATARAALATQPPPNQPPPPSPAAAVTAGASSGSQRSRPADG